jgi:FHA domain
MVASVAVEEVLFLLKIGFLVLLYLFIWRVVRTASRDLRSAPQESMVLAPQREQERKKRSRAKEAGRLVVVSSPALESGDRRTIDSAPLTIGREPGNDLALPRDEFSSGRHARVEPRPDGVWIEDIGSTNGTFVNGVRLTVRRKLVPGDLIRIGETDLRFER